MGTIASEGAGATRTEQVTSALLDRIERGVLATGARLPSIRAAARAFAVSKNTAVTAYERLVASGRVESRPGSGFYVTGRKPVPTIVLPPASVEAVDSVWLLREQLDRHYEVRAGDGRPPPSWMEGSEIGRHLWAASRRRQDPPESYGSPYGYLPLRQRLALTLAERSIAADPDRILMTSGANHALDLIIRQLVAADEPVLVDDPGYYPLFGKLRLARARLIGVRRNPDGPDVDDLADKIAATGARLFFTQSLAHNPTGCSLSLAVAYRVLQAATAADLRIVESDPFGDVMPASSPRLAALDQLERVTYVGTFAKTLSASLRSGFIAAEPGLIAALRDLKMVTSVNSSGFVEGALHDVIESGRYRRHLRQLAVRIEAAAVQGRETVRRLGLELYGQPSGGFYLWCRLPDGCDVERLSRQAAAQSVLIAPGSVFRPDGRSDAPMTRLNVAYLGDRRFEHFLRSHLGAG